MDFNKMTNDELEDLQANIGIELERRKRQLRQKLWEDVVIAMKNYVKDFREITIDGFPVNFENSHIGILQIRR